MKKIKNIIILLSIVLIIGLICIWIILKNIEKNEPDQFAQTEADISGDFIKSMGIVEDYTTFFSVEKMLNNYMKYVQSKNQEGIYSLLDDRYISENNITQENVLTYIANIINYDPEVRIRKMYGQENMANGIYYIDCILEKNYQGEQYYFAIYEDKQNLTYSVAQIEKETYEQKIKNAEQDLEGKRIEANEYNKSTTVYLSGEEIATRYFQDVLENILYYPEYTYNMLDAEYKSKCFTTLQEFKEYIDNKRDIFSSYDMTKLKEFGEFSSMEEYMLYLAQVKNIKLDEYQIRKNEQYNRYMCIDNFENYYIFYATSPLNYTVILDNYSVTTDEFKEEYNKKSESEKVILNIKRFFMGIDDKNYGYSYSVLSEAFKNNKYPTKDDFVNYAKQNFFEQNDVKYISFEKENGVYIYKIKISDGTRKSTEEREINVVVKLNNGTDFDMSFEIN